MSYKNKLEQEIVELRRVLSVDIPQELKDATETGDARENSDYAAVLSRQYIITIRMTQLLARLRAHKDLDLEKIPRDAVGIGSLVTVTQKGSKGAKIFKIVIADDEEESAIYTEITINSPAGKALMGKKVNDTVIVKGPAALITYTIKELRTIHDLDK